MNVSISTYQNRAAQILL